MSKPHRKKLLYALVLIAACLIYSGNVFAAVPEPNVVMALGSFNYVHDDILGYGSLSIVLSSISSVKHADGSIGSNVCLPFMGPCSVDAIYGGSVTLSTFTNSSGNWTFTPTTTSGPEMTLKDKNGVTRLTADIWELTVDKTPSGATFIYEVNVGFNEGNVGPISTYTGATSQFMNDVNSFSPPWGELYLKFNFTGDGPHDFTQSESGSISSTFAVVPEPISSILFLTGGVALAFRRYTRNK